MYKFLIKIPSVEKVGQVHSPNGSELNDSHGVRAIHFTGEIELVVVSRVSVAGMRGGSGISENGLVVLSIHAGRIGSSGSESFAAASIC